MVTEDSFIEESGSASNINEFGTWLRFETLTCCHIDTSVVLPELLSKGETEWLNSYNAHVYETLSPRLEKETAAWLESKTAAL